MIQTQENRQKGLTQIIVRGNRSMGWRENMLLASSLGLLSIGSSIVFALMGFWLALPFAGVELMVLFVCFYKTLKRLDEQEVISISTDLITVEWGENQATYSVQVSRQ
jgi:uncharacterized membrane protein